MKTDLYSVASATFFFSFLSLMLLAFIVYSIGRSTAFHRAWHRRRAVRIVHDGRVTHRVGPHRFRDPTLARMARAAQAVGATMMAPAATQQVAPAQEAGRPQPQTTVEPPGGPFVRHSQPGRRSQYTSPGQAFGSLITQPLVAVPGYVSRFRTRVAAAGGASATTAVVATADAPWSAVSLVTLRDAFGTPLIVGPGYEMLFLVPKYSSQFGLLMTADPRNLPTFSPVATGVGASGNFTFVTCLPLEFAKAYGVISMANASLLPTLAFQLSAAASVYTTAPNTTVPTLTFDTDADFYWLPEGVTIEPPGLGTTCQWVLQNCSPTIGSASATTVSLPRLGGFIHTIILILRDSTGARIDGYGTRVRIYVDGVPLIDTRFDTLADDMAIQYGFTPNYTVTTPANTRDTGVVAITRRTSLSQVNLGLLDTGETFLSTNPGTLIQVECTPWGTIANAPATLSAVVGQVVPAGSLVQGLPEL